MTTRRSFFRRLAVTATILILAPKIAFGIERCPSLKRALPDTSALVNDDYFAIVDAWDCPGYATSDWHVTKGAFTGLELLNLGEHMSDDWVIRVASRCGLTDCAAQFMADRRIIIFARNKANEPVRGEWTVKGAKAVSDGYADVLISPLNNPDACPFQDYPGQPAGGILLFWTNDDPALCPENRNRFWYQTDGQFYGRSDEYKTLLRAAMKECA